MYSSDELLENEYIGNDGTIVIGNSNSIKSLGSIKTIRDVSKKIVEQSKRDLKESAKSKMQVFSDSMLKMLKAQPYDSEDLSGFEFLE